MKKLLVFALVGTLWAASALGQNQTPTSLTATPEDEQLLDQNPVPTPVPAPSPVSSPVPTPVPTPVPILIPEESLGTTPDSKPVPTPQPSETSDSTLVSLAATTDFPIWVGGEAEIFFERHFSFNVGGGFIPPGYSSIVGNLVSQISGESYYQLLVTSLTQQNFAWKLGADYHFSGKNRWLIGIDTYFFSASGQASVVSILEAITGQDYSTLLGTSTTVFAQSDFFIGEVHGGYTFPLTDNLSLRTLLGVAKIFSSTVKLSSSSAVFDRSASGRAAYAASESYIENELLTYGISPTIKVSLIYTF